MNPLDNGHDRPTIEPVKHAYAFERNGRELKTMCGKWVPDRELAPRPSDVTCAACRTETDAFDAMEI
jgi:hypothetical protein